jgi:hypothetical protein
MLGAEQFAATMPPKSPMNSNHKMKGFSALPWAE